VDDNRHPMFVRGVEYGAQSFDVLGILDVHVGIGEMQFETGPQMRILCAARNLLERVVSQRVDAAEANQTILELCDFAAGPVVFIDDSRALVLDLRRTVRVTERVRLREDSRAPDAGGVEQRDQIGRCDWFDSCRRCDDGAVQVLVVVGDRAYLVLHRFDRGGA
jgi:hypothetical protein